MLSNRILNSILLCCLFFVFACSEAAGQYNPADFDLSFNGTGQFTTQVGFFSGANASVIQPDGRIVVVGLALQAPDVPAFALIRLNANGTLDSSFGSGGKVLTSNAFTNQASAVALQSDGKIIVAGTTPVANNNSDIVLVRYNSNGTIDSTFDGDGFATIDFGSTSEAPTKLLIQPDGKIVVAGYGSFQGSGVDFLMARVNPNGSLDTSFDSDGKVTTTVSGDDFLYSAALQADGKIVAAGYISRETAAVRYNSNGSLDTTFGNNGTSIISFASSANNGAKAVAIQPDQKIVLGGFAQIGFSSPIDNNFTAVRLNQDGTLDNSFGTGGRTLVSFGTTNCSAQSMAIQVNGKVLLAGSTQITTQPNPSNYFTFVRLNANGTIDSNFDGDGKFSTNAIGNGFAESVSLQRDGRIVAVGSIDLNTSAKMGVLQLWGDPVNKSVIDFDGDRRSDISIFRPAAGEWWLLRSSDGGNRAAQFGQSTDKLTPGDYTGDGKTDIAFWRPGTGEWFILRSEDSSFFSFPFGASGDIPAPADYDGDGKTDSVVYRPSLGTWFILNSGGSGVSIIGFGAAGDKPVTADYDGDGKSDVAIFRPSDGSWWYLRSSDGQFRVYSFGVSTDKCVPGDWTGDGKADIAVWRPSTGFWFIQRSEDNSYFSFPFGAAGDSPVPGDYDGDGRMDPAVFRPSNSTWFINRTTSGISIVTFGINGDQPVPGAFIP